MSPTRAPASVPGGPSGGGAGGPAAPAHPAFHKVVSNDLQAFERGSSVSDRVPTPSKQSVTALATALGVGSVTGRTDSGSPGGAMVLPGGQVVLPGAVPVAPASPGGRTMLSSQSFRRPKSATAAAVAGPPDLSTVSVHTREMREREEAERRRQEEAEDADEQKVGWVWVAATDVASWAWPAGLSWVRQTAFSRLQHPLVSTLVCVPPSMV